MRAGNDLQLLLYRGSLNTLPHNDAHYQAYSVESVTCGSLLYNTQMSQGSLEIQVLAGSGFKNENSKYAKFSTQNEVVRTKGQKGMGVTWNESVTLPIKLGIFSIQIDVYEEKLLSDKLVGTKGYSLLQTFQTFTPLDFWIELQGGSGNVGRIHLILTFKPNPIPCGYPPMPHQQQHPLPAPAIYQNQQHPLPAPTPAIYQNQQHPPAVQSTKPSQSSLLPPSVHSQPSQSSVLALEQKAPLPSTNHQRNPSIGSQSQVIDLIGKLEIQVINGKDLEKSGSLLRKDSYFVQASSNVTPKKIVKCKDSEHGKNYPIWNDLLVLRMHRGYTKLTLDVCNSHNSSIVGSGELDLSSFLNGIQTGQIQVILMFIPEEANSSPTPSAFSADSPSAPPSNSKYLDAEPPSALAELPPYSILGSSVEPPSKPVLPQTPIQQQQVYVPYPNQQQVYVPYPNQQQVYVPYPNQQQQPSPQNYVPFNTQPPYFLQLQQPSYQPQAAQARPYKSSYPGGQYNPK